MTQIVREVPVACPPEHVCAVLSDVEALAECSHLTVEIRKGPGRPAEVGDPFEQAVRVFIVELDTRCEADHAS